MEDNQVNGVWKEIQHHRANCQGRVFSQRLNFKLALSWVFQFVLKYREVAVWKMSAFSKCLIAVACVFQTIKKFHSEAIRKLFPATLIYL